ncbi:nucleoside 2-deoxyribosyltransferase [Vagococcus acidifermentans]|uniref:Nucleoside 2-deoxyribosyltransferase n=1 Tax=Vagococcus acidifermentans TaxID=564710 RepID=A0A430AUW0_9ENTE|nr:nucleoside 2-deoxyribosyltransferase [Vagococcus acidifermentans]RSU11839.1 nucleoside 2-deoxyribosyltransferase [Vagococcus acidifermentans]
MTSQIYYASPLFSNMEQQYNAHIVAKLRSLYPQESFYVPQEQTAINDKQAYADAKMIAQYDTEQLLKSKLMLAVLDGPTIDVGVASEIGVAYQAGIPIVALFSDSRQQGADHPEKIAALKDVAESQFPYVNLYTVGLVKLNGAVYATEDDWMRGIAAYL